MYRGIRIALALSAVLLAACATTRTQKRPDLASTPGRIHDVARSGREESRPAERRQPAPEPAMEPTEPAAGAALEAEIPLDPAVRHGVLGNGLQYYVRANHKPENRLELRLIVDAGSILEDDDQRGLAHFVEHMAFNGTEHFEEHELIDYLELIGMRFGPDINAFTSFDQTVYMLQVPTDDQEIVDKAFLILEDWAGGVTFEDEEIDKERGVVLEEWRLGRGAQARMRDEQFPILFKGSRYAERLTIGKPEVIENASYDTVRRFYRDWYRPGLMAVVAVGDMDPDALVAQIRERFSDLENPENPRPRAEWPVPDHEETLFAIATDPEATRTSVSVYYKHEPDPEGTVRDYRRGLVKGLYYGMLNDRLAELTRQPDPPFLFGFTGEGGFVRTKDVLAQTAGVQSGGAERGLEALLQEVERVDRYGFTATELERKKKEILRSYEQAWRERDKRQSGSFTWEYMSNYLEDEPAPGIEWEREAAESLLPGITLEEVNRLASESITDENRVITFNGPEEEATPTEADLLAAFRRAESAEVAAYEDRVREEPLVPRPPDPGRIDEVSVIPELGVTEWELSNGVRVVLKPTDFQNDQILFTAWSPGGHSLVDDEDYETAIYATSMVGSGGVGSFDPIELQKALADKVVRVNPYISELEEGLSGAASPQDLETALQLVYLTITAPRRDESMVEAWRDRSKAALEHRLSRPETVFGDRWRIVASQDHFRRQPPSLDRLEHADLDTAMRVYRDRFRDASDFTFVFVGNFELAQMRPLVERWIGGLPALDREETWRDVGVEQPGGVVDFEVRRGLEPKSAVRIMFHGKAPYSREEAHILSSLTQALRIRLREVLREDMGGTYGVGVWGGLNRRPDEDYAVMISFGAAPENVEEMIDAVFEEIDEIKKDGIGAEYVDKVKEGQLRGRETDLEENRFWLNALESYYTYGEDPRLILDYEDLVETVTPERLQQAARRYLDEDRYVLGVLYPEKEAMAAGGGEGSSD